MTKGRGSNPSTENIGNWYKHKNCAEYLSVGSRSSVTSTGFMLDREPRLSKPMTPPPIHQQRSQTIYSHTNPFSDHDNRNDIQLKGEYMGNGKDTRLLGRRLASATKNQHTTETSDFLKHHSRRETDSFFHTNYMISHTGKTAPGSAAKSRRFPKEYKAPQEGPTSIGTSTTNQFTVESGLLPFNTNNQVLVSSIEPYSKHNAWKYTYHRHGKNDIYPKVWGDRCATRFTQHKPRPRPVIVNRIIRHCSDPCI